MVLARVWGRIDLSLEEIADDLESGELLGRLRCLRSWCGTCLVGSLLYAGACIATSLWNPAVMRLLPWLGAELDEVLFPLFGVLGLSFCFVAQVMLFVFENRLQSLSCLDVDGFVVLVKGGLPGCLSAVMESISPFPGCQSRISLAPSKLGLVARGVWGPGAAADVEDGDAAAVLVGDLCQEVWVRVPVR